MIEDRIEDQVEQMLQHVKDETKRARMKKALTQQLVALEKIKQIDDDDDSNSELSIC